jgi:hypothetical protein
VQQSQGEVKIKGLTNPQAVDALKFIGIDNVWHPGMQDKQDGKKSPCRSND